MFLNGNAKKFGRFRMISNDEMRKTCAREYDRVFDADDRKEERDSKAAEEEKEEEFFFVAEREERKFSRKNKRYKNASESALKRERTSARDDSENRAKSADDDANDCERLRTTITTITNKREEGPVKKKKKTRQLYLDLGQKSFRHTTCAECGLVYVIGEPSDEEVHRRHHNKFALDKERFEKVNLRNLNSFFHDERGKHWHEYVMENDLVCRVYRVTKRLCDKHAWLKIRKVAKMVEDEIGAVEDWVLSFDGEDSLNNNNNNNVGGGDNVGIVAFVCVLVGKKENECNIIGAAFCEDIVAQKREVFETTTTCTNNNDNKSDAKNSRSDVEKLDTTLVNPIINTTTSSHYVLKKGPKRTTLDFKPRGSVGVRALWVHKTYRRMSVARNLLENCRRRFFGEASMVGSATIVSVENCAFSQPTDQGARFISKYVGEKFLVYE